MTASFQVTIDIEFEHQPGIAPYLSGLPEHCHEGQAEEIFVTAIHVDGDEENLVYHLPKQIVRIAEQKARETLESQALDHALSCAGLN